MRDLYDVAVIGAGPAGLSAVNHLLGGSEKPSVLLLDKTAPWEHPKACAEGVGKAGLENAVAVKPSWVRYVVRKASFHAPCGESIVYEDKNEGLIIDRPRMQRDMALGCEELGADVHCDMQVTGVSALMGGGRIVYFKNGTSVSARVVIDASGPVSGLGRREKIRWKPGDLEPSCAAIVEGVEIAEDSIHIYLGKNVAPGGYAWVFPRAPNIVNAGIVIGKAYRKTANLGGLLDAFIAKNLPDGKILRRSGGAIPCSDGSGPMAVGGMIKAGDAASTVNPVSRAGIVQAMVSGGLAGDFALKMLGARDLKALNGLCRDYGKSWHERCGATHARLSRVKNSLNSVPDADYDRAARALSAIPEGKLTMSAIFKSSLGRFPRLVWAMRHMM